MDERRALGAVICPIRPMRILITGGFGYIGGRLAQHFASRGGYDIVLGSRNCKEVPAWLPQANVVNIPWDSPSSLEEVCAGFDVIIHAAGMNAQDSYADPVAALQVNGAMTGSLLQAAIRQTIKRFIYISTAHVYGSPLEGRIAEESCLRSLHPYATSHRAGEDMVRYAHQRGQIEGIVVRLSNAFGAPSYKDVNCWTLLVNDLCRQLVKSGRLVLQSSGQQYRNFITIQDVARAMEHLLKSTSTVIGNGLFNLGGARSFTVIEMAELIAERGRIAFGIDAKISRPEFSESIQYNKIEPLIYDISKLQRTGFRLIGNMSLEIDNTLRLCAEMSGVVN